MCMLFRLSTLALFVLLCTCVRAQTEADVRALGFDPERLARVDGFLSDLVTDGVVPNAQALVLRRGRVVYRSHFGYADLERRTPVRADAIYRIASQTKAMVTVALMMEFERGKFLLEDPVADYIPAFREPRVIVEHGSEPGTYVTEPARRPITIRQLLSHSSGIPYGLPNGPPPGADVPFFFTLEDESTEEIVNRIARRPLLHHPGEGFTYGLSTDVAGRLLEVISGQPLDRYLAEHLWRPLGMNDSHFYLPPAKHNRLVELYSRHQPGAPLSLHEKTDYRTYPIAGAQRYHSGGAGSVGTIDDYARFCQMMLNRGELDGHRFLAPKTVDLMLRNHIGAAEVWDRRDKFGLGFQLIGPGSRYGDQATPGAFTWGGLFCSEYTIDPAEELVMLVYTNVEPIPEYSEIVRKFRVLVYQALVGE